MCTCTEHVPLRSEVRGGVFLFGLSLGSTLSSIFWKTQKLQMYQIIISMLFQYLFYSSIRMHVYMLFLYIYLYVWTTFWISVILVLFQWKLCNIYEESGFSSIKLPKYLLRFTHSPDLLVHEIKYIEHQTFIQIKSLFYLVQSVPLWSFFIFHKKWCSVINATVSKTKGEKKDKKEEGNQSKNKTTYSSKLKPAWYSYAG